MVRQLRHQILGFVGIKPARITYSSGASHPKSGLVERWIAEVERSGSVAA